MNNSSSFLRRIASVQVVIGIIGSVFLVLREIESSFIAIIVGGLIIVACLVTYAVLLSLADRTEAICKIADLYYTGAEKQRVQKNASNTNSLSKTLQSKVSTSKQLSCPHCGNSPTISPCDMCGKTF